MRKIDFKTKFSKRGYSLFFDFGIVVSVSRYKPEREWLLLLGVNGENYETKRYETASLATNMGFETAEDAARHGMMICELLGVECLEIDLEDEFGEVTSLDDKFDLDDDEDHCC